MRSFQTMTELYRHIKADLVISASAVTYPLFKAAAIDILNENMRHLLNLLHKVAVYYVWMHTKTCPGICLLQNAGEQIAVSKHCFFWLLDGKRDLLPGIPPDIDITHRPGHYFLNLITVFNQVAGSVGLCVLNGPINLSQNFWR